MGRLTVGPALGKKKKQQRVEEGLHQERLVPEGFHEIKQIGRSGRGTVRRCDQSKTNI